MKVRYIGEQEAAETNVGRFSPGQVAEVLTDGGMAFAKTLICNGQFEEVPKSTPIGPVKNWQPAKAKK